MLGASPSFTQSFWVLKGWTGFRLRQNGSLTATSRSKQLASWVKGGLPTMYTLWLGVQRKRSGFGSSTFVVPWSLAKRKMRCICEEAYLAKWIGTGKNRGFVPRQIVPLLFFSSRQCQMVCKIFSHLPAESESLKWRRATQLLQHC